MNLKKVGSIICATGVVFSLAIPASAAVVPTSNEAIAKEAMVSTRGMVQDLFNTGTVFIDARERTIATVNSSDSASQLGVFFEGVDFSGQVQVNVYVGNMKYSEVVTLQKGGQASSNMASFLNIGIWKNAPIEVTVQCLRFGGMVDNINAICF